MTDNKDREACPLRVLENAEGTWDILVDGALTHPRLTQWTRGGAEEAVRLIHDAYTRSRAAVAAPQGDAKFVPPAPGWTARYPAGTGYTPNGAIARDNFSVVESYSIQRAKRESK